MRLLPGTDSQRVPWRNGGGFTREFVREPMADEQFHWRVSVAEVADDGPFSSFDGYDRILVLLGGEGMDLYFSESQETLHLRSLFDVVSFAGEAAVRASLLDGPTTDLNLIWLRGDRRATATVCVVEAAMGWGGHPAETVVAYVAGGSLSAASQFVAMPGDVVVGDPGERVSLSGPGTAIVLTIATLRH